MHTPPSSSQFLPELNHAQAEGRAVRKSPRASVQTQTTTPLQPDRPNAPANGGDQLPPLVLIPNSALVHQRAVSSTGDHLAAASMSAGAALPLMIGNRSKCVLNLVGEPAPAPAPSGASKAEQRRQSNMAHVSVVRPVVNTSQQQATSYEPFGQPNQQLREPCAKGIQASSLIDDWMQLDRSINSKGDSSASSSLLDELILGAGLNIGRLQPVDSRDCTVMASWSHIAMGNTSGQELMRSEQAMRQRVLMLRREEHELNRTVMRQHHFVLAKIEERKRQLQIIQSVWTQRDFKHAIERMIDIYQQGLIFTHEAASDFGKAPHNADGAAFNGNTAGLPLSRLNSLNTSLVVDVLGVLILRPRLWTLEICQLLLPIVNSDLLAQRSCRREREHEHYTEIGLKTIRLVLAHFSSVLKSTFDSLKESSKLVGVDLSREDRVNKCLACYKLLLESHSTILSSSGCKQAKQTVATYENQQAAGRPNKLAALQAELKAMFASLTSSIDLDADQLARHFHQNNRR